MLLISASHPIPVDFSHPPVHTCLNPATTMRLLLLTACLALATLQTATAQPTDLRGARLFKSGPIQITADGSRLWCVNPDNNSLTRIVTATEVATEFLLPAVAGRHAPRGLRQGRWLRSLGGLSRFRSRVRAGWL